MYILKKLKYHIYIYVFKKLSIFYVYNKFYNILLLNNIIIKYCYYVL